MDKHPGEEKLDRNGKPKDGQGEEGGPSDCKVNHDKGEDDLERTKPDVMQVIQDVQDLEDISGNKLDRLSDWVNLKSWISTSSPIMDDDDDTCLAPLDISRTWLKMAALRLERILMPVL